MRLTKDTQQNTRLQRQSIVERLDLCLSTYFNHNGTIYQQFRETHTGSPISGFVTEAAMQKLETTLPTINPKLWIRYVVIKTKDMETHTHTKKQRVR